jgi:hypothetical protein
MNIREINIRRETRRLHRARKRFQKALRRTYAVAHRDRDIRLNLNMNLLLAQMQYRMSLAQYMMAIHTPIPRFSPGAEPPKEIAIVGEGGPMREVFRLPNGEIVRAAHLTVGRYVTVKSAEEIGAHNLSVGYEILRLPDENV